MDEIIEFSGIGDFIDVPVKRYSSGMYLRLAFSVAINMNPDILLADEVLAVGDQDFQERCLERVQHAGRAGMSVLFVSHDMAAISRLCDKVLWLNAGEIVKIGDPDEVVTEYQNTAWSTTGRRLKDKRSGSHKNQVGEILFVVLTSPDGREVGAVKASDEVIVKVAIRFDEGNLTARYILHIHARGAVAFRSRSETVTVDQAGTYVAAIRIPRQPARRDHLLGELDASVFRNETEKLPMVAFNALSFQVFDPDSGRRDNLGGMVATGSNGTSACRLRRRPGGGREPEHPPPPAPPACQAMPISGQQRPVHEAHVEDHPRDQVSGDQHRGRHCRLAGLGAHSHALA